MSYPIFFLYLFLSISTNYAREGDPLLISTYYISVSAFLITFCFFPGTAFDFCQNTGPFNVTGHPALSINAGFSDGLPVGMMIVGKKFDEPTVLNVAFAYEKIRASNVL